MRRRAKVAAGAHVIKHAQQPSCCQPASSHSQLQEVCMNGRQVLRGWLQPLQRRQQRQDAHSWLPTCHQMVLVAPTQAADCARQHGQGRMLLPVRQRCRLNLWMHAAVMCWQCWGYAAFLTPMAVCLAELQQLYPGPPNCSVHITNTMQYVSRRDQDAVCSPHLPSIQTVSLPCCSTPCLDSHVSGASCICSAAHSRRNRDVCSVKPASAWPCSPLACPSLHVWATCNDRQFAEFRSCIGQCSSVLSLASDGHWC